VAFWAEKIARNRERDLRDVAALRSLGWRVCVVWECALRKAGFKVYGPALIDALGDWIRGGQPFLELYDPASILPASRYPAENAYGGFGRNGDEGLFVAERGGEYRGSEGGEELGTGRQEELAFAHALFQSPKACYFATMNQSEQASLAVACQHASRMIAELEGAVFTWAARRVQIDKEFARYSRKLKDEMERMPEEWVGMAAAQSATALVFGDPSKLKKCLAGIRDQVSDAACAFIASFLEKPWQFAYFTVSERHGSDFYTIHDHLGGEDLLLQSKSVTTLLRENKHTFFTLVFQTDTQSDSCWQTYGTVMPFQGISPEDMNYFAQAVDPGLYETQGTIAVASAKPVPFQFLFTYAEMPLVMHGDSPVAFSSSFIPVPDPMAIVLPKEIEVSDRDDVLKFKLGGEDYFDAISFYLDIGKKLAVLSSASRETYRKGVVLLESYVQFPPEPQYAISPLILMATKKIVGKKNPIAYYEDLFEEIKPKKESKELDGMNQVFSIMVERHNQGVPIDPETFAREMGQPVEMVNQLMKILGGWDKKLAISLDYGIKGFVPPPPAVRHLMTGSFEFNSLFVFNSGRAVKSMYDERGPSRVILLNGYGLSPITPLKEYPSQMDGIFEKYWERDDRTLFLYSLYLLHECGDTFHLAREYASEVLRIFHHIIIPDQNPGTIDGFIRKYSRFIHQALVPAGLVETGPVQELKEIRAGTFSMRGTAFFRAWLDWRG